MQSPIITIGDRALLANFPQLLIPKSEEARIDIDVDDWKLRIAISFEDNGSTQGIEVRPENGGVRLIFANWSNSIGTSLQQPATLASLVDGSSVEFLAANYRIGEMNIFSLELLHARGKK